MSASRAAHSSSLAASRKPYRFSQTASPDQLLPVPAQHALMLAWSLRARYWQRRPDQTPDWRWGRDSEPLEPEQREGRCPSHILHAMTMAALLYLLALELERGLRLLLASRERPWGEDAQRALTGVLGRVGQVYVELQRRRRGKGRALATLLSELARLPGGLAEAARGGA